MAKKAKVQKISKAKTAKKAVVITTATPLEESNGIKKPREGGVCRRVWDWLDDHKGATAAELRAWAESEKLNQSNASQEASRWRRFNNVTKAKEVKKAA